MSRNINIDLQQILNATILGIGMATTQKILDTSITANKISPSSFMQMMGDKPGMKCTKCGVNLVQQRKIPPNPISHPFATGAIFSGSVVTSGANISNLGTYPSLAKNAITIVISRNDHTYQGHFCRWECMIEWLNDDLLPQMVGDVLTE